MLLLWAHNSLNKEFSEKPDKFGTLIFIMICVW